MKSLDTFNSRSLLRIDDTDYCYFSLSKLMDRLDVDSEKLPISIKIMLENMLRHEDGAGIQKMHIEALGRWHPTLDSRQEVPFMPARVLMQGFYRRSGGGGSCGHAGRSGPVGR